MHSLTLHGTVLTDAARHAARSHRPLAVHRRHHALPHFTWNSSHHVIGAHSLQARSLVHLHAVAASGAAISQHPLAVHDLDGARGSALARFGPDQRLGASSR